MRRTVIRRAALAVACLGTAGLLRAQAPASPPDFSGVYRPVNAFGPPPAGAGKQAGKQKGPPARPIRSAPIADGSQGRSPDAPALTPEYMAKWEATRKSRMAGSYDTDRTAKCLPPGMPAMMNMAYGMEVMQTKDKITFFSELNDALRRVYLDGRKPSQKVLDDPTYAGYSAGHWEGDTLVVDTAAIRDDTYIEGFTPHSDQMTIHERIRFASDGVLEDRITVNDPKALTKSWETVKRYRRARPGDDELREFACPEGLADAR